MSRLKTLVIASVALFLSTCSAQTRESETHNSSPTTNVSISFPEQDAIARSFADAFGKDVEVLDHRTAFVDPTNRESGLALLMHVRPKHPGRFVFRYEFDTRKGASETQEYYIVVSDARVARQIDWRDGGMFPLPIACLGDELILPFAVNNRAKNPRFSSKPADAHAARVWFDVQEKPAEKPSTANDLEVDNGAAAHFKLISSSITDSVTADGQSHLQSAGVLLGAQAAGRFNLLINVGKGHDLQVIPVVIVPKDQPLPILAPQSLRIERAGGPSSSSYERYNLKTLVLRVGDQVSLPCSSSMSAGEKKSLPHIELMERAFVERPGDFGFIGAPK